jgi:N-acetylmuramic acid 6-phosphate (MurNAc-6-P) etherase
MRKSYSKIRHIQESNIKLEKRLIGEQLSVDNAIDTIKSSIPKNPKDVVEIIKNNLPTIIMTITSFIPQLALPRLIYFIVSGGPQDLMKQMEGYKDKIDADLKRRNISISTKDIVDNISEIKDELVSELKKRVGNPLK